MHLTIAAVNTGVISVGLLQVLTGSWLAVLLHRRRTLCLLDQLYFAIDCHKQSDFIQITPALAQELLMLCIIAPVVQCNLRLEPPCKLFTVDASQHTIAVLEACVPRALGAVLHRFAVRQGKWTKFLTAPGAYLRERDLLPPEEELPESGY